MNKAIAFEPPEVCDPPGAGFREADGSKRFFLHWLMGLMVFTPGLTLSGLYKRFGMTSGAVIADDRFESAMGGLAAVANGLGRVFFGARSTRRGVKGYGVTAAATAALMLAFPFTVSSKLAYASALIGPDLRARRLDGDVHRGERADSACARRARSTRPLLGDRAASLVRRRRRRRRLLAPLGWSGPSRCSRRWDALAAGLIYLRCLEKKNPGRGSRRAASGHARACARRRRRRRRPRVCAASAARRGPNCLGPT